MTIYTPRILAISVCLFFTYSLTAQLVATSLGQTITVDFDSSVAGVCDGPIKGTGFTANPTAGSGMLDSDAIAFSGLVNPATMDFGGTATTGDAARGIASNGNNGSGFYAFEPSIGDGRAFGFQPSADHFNPGTITLKFTNQTGFPVNEFSIALKVYLKNDSNRSTNYSFAFSTDGINYETQPGFDTPRFPIPFFTNWIGPSTDDRLNINQDVCVPEPLPNNSSVFVRFIIQDNGVGTNTGGDEIAFDDIAFTISERAFCAATDVMDVEVNRSATNTEATVNWTNPTGCFDDIIVVARAANAVTANISNATIDGLTLSQIDPNTNVNANWNERNTNNEVFAVSEENVGTAAEDYFVYRGSGTSTTVTNLDPAIDYHFRVLAVSAGCDWAMGQDGFSAGVALNTELLHFTADQQKEVIQLTWDVIHDGTHAAKVVEHSTDGQNFQPLKEYSPTVMQGESQYHFVDTQPVSGWNYYRLKLQDMDGSFQFSPVRSVYYFNATHTQLIPNYSHQQLTVLNLPVNADIAYHIYNYQGQIQRQGKLQSIISLQQLPVGVYVMVIDQHISIPFVWH